MKVLEIEGIGSAALPKGLPNVSWAEYQDFYDKKYFAPDPPPLKQAPPPAGSGVGSGQRPPPLTAGSAKNGGLVLPSLPSPSNSVSSGKSGVLHKEKKNKDKDKEKEKKKGFFHF